MIWRAEARPCLTRTKHIDGARASFFLGIQTWRNYLDTLLHYNSFRASSRPSPLRISASILQHAQGVFNHPFPPIPLATYSTSNAQMQVLVQESSSSQEHQRALQNHYADPKTNNATAAVQQPSLVFQLVSESGPLWD